MAGNGLEVIGFRIDIPSFHGLNGRIAGVWRLSANANPESLPGEVVLFHKNAYIRHIIAGFARYKEKALSGGSFLRRKKT